MDLNEMAPEIEVDELSDKLTDSVAIVFSEEELQKAREEFENIVAVKMFGGRGYNKWAFKDVLRQSWRPKGEISFMEVENNVLLAKFEREEDMDWVLQGGPWRYMGWAIEVAKWVPDKNLDELFSGKIPIWVQIHNLRVEMRRDDMAIRFAEKVGKVIRSSGSKEKGQKRDERRVFARFLVELNLNKPVVPGWSLGRTNDTDLWVDFRYEQLPNICFNCGGFSHDASQCSVRVSMRNEGKFGPWLRAEHIAVERLGSGGRWRSNHGVAADQKQGRSEGSRKLRTVGDEEAPNMQMVVNETYGNSDDMLALENEETFQSTKKAIDKGKGVMERGIGSGKVLDGLGKDLDRRSKNGPGNDNVLLLMGDETIEYGYEENGLIGPRNFNEPDGLSRKETRGEKRKLVTDGDNSDKFNRRSGDGQRRNKRKENVVGGLSELGKEDGKEWNEGGLTYLDSQAAPAGDQRRRAQ